MNTAKEPAAGAVQQVAASALLAHGWAQPQSFGSLEVSLHLVQPGRAPASGTYAGSSGAALPGTSRGFTLARPGLLVVIRKGGVLALGEASPLPGFGGDDTLGRAFADLAAFDWSRLDRASAALPSRDEFAALAEGVTSASARHAIEGAALELSPARASVPPERLLAALAGRGTARSGNLVQPSTVLDPLAAEYDAELDRALAAGYRTLKLKCGRDVPAEVAVIARTSERLHARSTVASLRLDANLALDAASALALVRGATEAGFLPRKLDEAAEGLALDWIEDPTPTPEEWPALAAHCLVAADEILVTEAARPRAFASGARVFIAKPMMLGGVTPVLSLAASALERGGLVSLSHAFDGPVALALAAGLAAALQPQTFAAGLGSHAALDGWNTASAEPPLPADLRWPEAPLLAPPAPGAQGA